MIVVVLGVFIFPSKVAFSATKLNTPINNRLTSGLVGLWSFDGPDLISTTAYDRSGQGNTGTLTGFGTAATTSKKIGVLGQALQLDGVNDYITVSDSSSLDVGNNFTLSAWVKLTINQSTSVISKSYVGASTVPYALGFGLSDGVDDSLQFGFFNGGWSLVKQTGSFNTSQWVHIAGTWDGTTARLYINGVQNNSATPGGTAVDNNDSIYIGRRHDAFFTDEYTKGVIDDARIYNRALSTSEITSLYKLGQSTFQKSQNAKVTSSLVGLWSMDAPDVDFTGTTLSIKDRSTFANHAKFSTTATSSRRVLGALGQALKFNGTTDYFYAPTSSNYNFGSNNFAISWWENRTTNLAGSVAITRSEGVIGYNPFLLGYSAGGANLLIYMTSVYNTWNIANAKSLGAVTLNVWNHFLVTRSGSTFTAYKNGVQTDSWTSSIAFTAPSGNTDLIFGRYTYGVNYFLNGSLDDVRIYSSAFSASDVIKIYNTGKVTFQKSQNAKVTSGLVGLWSFDGPDLISTTAYDRSGQGNNATLTGFGTTATSSKKAGVIGQALQFDGVDDYVLTGTFASIPTSVTLSAWIYPTAGGVVFDEIGAGGWHDSQMEVLSTGEIKVGYWTGGLSNISLGTFSLNAWHHVVLTYDTTSTTGKGYVDGVLRNSMVIAKQWPGSALQYGIGKTDVVTNMGDGTYFNGKIDDARIYSRALTAAEVTRLYSIGR